MDPVETIDLFIAGYRASIGKRPDTRGRCRRTGTYIQAGCAHHAFPRVSRRLKLKINAQHISRGGSGRNLIPITADAQDRDHGVLLNAGYLCIARARAGAYVQAGRQHTAQHSLPRGRCGSGAGRWRDGDHAAQADIGLGDIAGSGAILDFVKITGCPNNCNLSAAWQPADSAVARAGAGAHIEAGGDVDDAGLVQGGIGGVGLDHRKANIILGNIAGPGAIPDPVEAAGDADDGNGSAAGQRADAAILGAGAGAHIEAGGLDGPLLGVGCHRIAALLQIAAGNIACKAVRLDTGPSVGLSEDGHAVAMMKAADNRSRRTGSGPKIQRRSALLQRYDSRPFRQGGGHSGNRSRQRQRQGSRSGLHGPGLCMHSRSPFISQCTYFIGFPVKKQPGNRWKGEIARTRQGGGCGWMTRAAGEVRMPTKAP